MPPNAETPAGGPGLGNSISTDTASDTKKLALVQAAILDLRREHIAECLRVTAIKASHAADNFLLRDDVCGEHDLHVAITHIKEAASGFRALQQLTAVGGQS